MSTIKDYKIAYGETMAALEQAVKQGWQPQGGIYVEMGVMYQALVKAES